MKKWTVTVLVVAGGCANPVNDATWSRYTREGNMAHGRGDLATAEEAHRRALINARIGNLGPEREATALHNMALAKRDLCKLSEAEEAWRRAFELRDKSGTTPPANLTGTIYELAQLLYEQGKYAEAAALMERGFSLLDKLGIEQKEPATYAHVLLEYAVALRGVNRMADADAALARANALAAARGVDTERKPNRPPFNHPVCR